MRRSCLVILTMLLLTAGLCFAQQDPAAPQQQPSTSQPSQTGVGQPTDTNEQLFKGCISGDKDNYTLSDGQSGQKYRLHSDKDISEHAGNMVEIRGTLKKEAMDSQKTSTSQQREIDVADIKTVSKGCSATGK